MSEYYNKDTLIWELSRDLSKRDNGMNKWDDVISKGEIYHGVVNGVTNPYIYEIKTRDGVYCAFVHPLICSVIFTGGWANQETFMNHEDGFL